MSASKRGYRGTVSQASMRGNAQERLQREKFKKENRVWSPGMKNHGMYRKPIPSSKLSEKDQIKAFINHIKTNKTPAQIDKMGGQLKKHAATKRKGGTAKKNVPLSKRVDRFTDAVKVEGKRVRATKRKGAPPKVKKGGGGRSWQDTIKYVKNQNPSMRYKDVLIKASKLYKGGASMLP